MIPKWLRGYFGVFFPDLRLWGGSKSVVFPRQVARYLVKQLTSASLPKIGREFGGRTSHHVYERDQKDRSPLYRHRSGPNNWQTVRFIALANFRQASPSSANDRASISVRRNVS